MDAPHAFISSEFKTNSLIAMEYDTTNVALVVMCFRNQFC